MGNLSESSIWSNYVFQKEIDTPVFGGPGGPSNTQAEQLANRTQKIKSVLKENSIFVDDSEFSYKGQNIIINAVFYSSVANGNWVYWNASQSKFYKATAGVSGDGSKVVGVADVTNGRVIVDGVYTISTSSTTGTIFYLSSSTSGVLTTSNTGVPIGVVISSNKLRITLHRYYSTDPVAGMAGLRTLGTGSQQACKGNDSRLIHTGHVTSNSTGGTTIANGVVTEARQSLSDNTTYNFSTSRHGYVPKGINQGKFLKDNGTWDDPIGGSYSVKAWVSFDGTNGSIRGSGNISSVTYQSTGRYRVNFSTPMIDVNYSITGWASGVDSYGWASCVSSGATNDTYSTTSFDLFIRNEGWNQYSPKIVNIHIIR